MGESSRSRRFGKAADILVRQDSPYNAGPPPRAAASFLTPADLFFVRNHGGIPEIDPRTFHLTIEGRVKRPFRISLEEIQRLPRVTVTATLQCAGNRRQELMEKRPIPGELGWGTEAISTADWGGVPLRDVLAVADPEPEGRHVELIGLDETERHGERFAFGGSIPLDKARRPEVLLAYEMNGQPLHPVHGAPLRLVVPGWIGARSVKWLTRINLRESPSENYFQAKAYRLFPPGVGPENVVWDDGMMLGEFNVSSVITSPADGETVAPGDTAVRGWAFAGERRISRVDVSTDGGRSWITAALEPERSRWAWRRWEARVDLPPGPCEIVCRAWDTAAQTQPENPEQVWNFKGYMNNAWHRVKISVG
ncbi:MAG TPA: sulfite oxidase [Thermoanaerobaculia bacterium]|nr:sulfite oxidase [Thermoanaerobaculia bacterium]